MSVIFFIIRILGNKHQNNHLLGTKTFLHLSPYTILYVVNCLTFFAKDDPIIVFSSIY